MALLLARASPVVRRVSGQSFADPAPKLLKLSHKLGQALPNVSKLMQSFAANPKHATNFPTAAQTSPKAPTNF